MVKKRKTKKCFCESPSPFYTVTYLNKHTADRYFKSGTPFLENGNIRIPQLYFCKFRTTGRAEEEPVREGERKATDGVARRRDGHWAGRKICSEADRLSWLWAGAKSRVTACGFPHEMECTVDCK